MGSEEQKDSSYSEKMTDGVASESKNVSDEAPQIRGILKSYSMQAMDKERRVQWDEDRITQQEALRGTRMKVDEPKTPFVRQVASDCLEDWEKAELELDKESDEDIRLGAYITSNNKSEGSDGTDDSGSGDEKQKELRRKGFEAKRAEHFNFHGFKEISKKKLEEEAIYSESHDEDMNEDEDEEDENENEEDENENEEDENENEEDENENEEDEGEGEEDEK